MTIFHKVLLKFKRISQEFIRLIIINLSYKNIIINYSTQGYLKVKILVTNKQSKVFWIHKNNHEFSIMKKEFNLL